MNEEALLDALCDVLEGTTLRLTFKQDAIFTVALVEHWVKEGRILIQPGQQTFMNAILQSLEWGMGDNGRTLEVRTTHQFHEDAFAQSLAESLVSVEVNSPIPFGYLVFLDTDDGKFKAMKQQGQVARAIKRGEDTTRFLITSTTYKSEAQKVASELNGASYTWELRCLSGDACEVIPVADNLPSLGSPDADVLDTFTSFRAAEEARMTLIGA
jgi:hypothetical protein